ncbi:hypothetical protein T4A_11257 [Trichinella pseudospiralis]|uniref:Uncharacterized protein n=1 Tax=Trichinella pseudospiralis TaxID=6337 RepID=A0A0V1DNZ3_TRIPS|nr:hypothetical protein T4A_744 [Trichinella pseudospiralis]KRY63722.1 hypothetical protein T4A_11257 [Trichinella pseudospiralis]
MDLLVLRKMPKNLFSKFGVSLIAISVSGINGRSVGVTSMFILWEASRQEFSFNRSLSLFFAT